MSTDASTLAAALIDRKEAIVREWLHRTLQTYPESTVGFLSQEKDPFRNPVGHTLKEGFSAIFDRMVRGTDPDSMTQVLDDIVRIRAVQDFTAGQAVAFVFLFKQAIRAELARDVTRFPDELAALENRIDEMALAAFDVFMKCREQIYEVRSNEVKRMVSVLKRSHQMGSAELIE